MQRSSLYIIFIVLATWQLSSCQTKKAVVDNSVIQTEESYLLTGAYKYVNYDELDHLYVVTENNEILQYKDKQLLFRYSNRRLGDITKLDVSNPQKILVHYGDFYQVVFLDNTLSEINRLDLEALGYWDVQGIALSRDNQIWFYDPVNVRLRKVNTAGQIQLSSNELFSYGFSDTFIPDILVANGMVYVYDENGLKVFDEFGVWQENIPLQNQGVIATARFLIYKSGNKLYSYSTAVQFQEPSQEITTLQSQVRGFCMSKDKIYMIDDKGLFTRNL